MIERITLLLAFSATLLVAIVSAGWAYWNHRDLVEEREQRFEHTAENDRLRTDLQEAVQKNLELARRLTQLAQELAEKKTALREASSSYSAFEARLATLDERFARAAGPEVSGELAGVKETLKAVRDDLDARRQESQKQAKNIVTRLEEANARQAQLANELATAADRR